MKEQTNLEKLKEMLSNLIEDDMDINDEVMDETLLNIVKNKIKSYEGDTKTN